LVHAQVACDQQLSTAAVILAFVGIAIGSRPGTDSSSPVGQAEPW